MNLKFSSLVLEIDSLIPEINARIGRNTNEQRKADLQLFLLSNLLEKTIAHYSAGHAKETVTESLLATISAFEDGFKWEGFEHSYAMYDQMVWLLSLGIVCDISDRDFRRIVAVIQRDGAADKLLALLVNYRVPGTISDYTKPYIQQEPYAAFDKVIEEPSIANVKTYLDTFWYKGHRDAPWYDAHKNTKVNVYFGYWSWESAALAKIVGLSDDALRDQKYYPYRAVHWDEAPMV
ncbi:MAG TPA: PoNe immunity protein domain-containing protein [Flavobacterium sp.]|nr:PoNe immunity protein domain-containing protein [Flavobacterium sp.]